jgi:hypothetical protein
MCSAFAKMTFFTQHILMNFNELIADWSFGEPETAVIGFGGLFGVKRLMRGVEGGNSVTEVLKLQLKAGRETCSVSDLKMMGLERL